MDKIFLIKQLLALYRKLASLLQKQLPVEKSKRQIVFETAKSCLGKDMAAIQDVFGCAEAVNAVVKLATGLPVGGGVSTYRMYLVLKNNSRFLKVSTPLPGDIIIAPTGFGNGKIPNGHVGICSDADNVMSNNSETKLWDEHYTYFAWEYRYKTLGGYPVYFYRVLS